MLLWMLIKPRAEGLKVLKLRQADVASNGVIVDSIRIQNSPIEPNKRHTASMDDVNSVAGRVHKRLGWFRTQPTSSLSLREYYVWYDTTCPQAASIQVKIAGEVCLSELPRTDVAHLRFPGNNGDVVHSDQQIMPASWKMGTLWMIAFHTIVSSDIDDIDLARFSTTFLRACMVSATSRP
ncbi:hypothetical protein BS47DRAFT_1395392 [Hydnum rufescens UP504]|uniref:Uncharacterized protein n=1 Tax=Hydnum rufescens UP504 TaxID=1448309 RepID=A0A9P6DRH6_9AGAM|nr:hypothetical protein BS47DRAFT_1395392 [Hydnum rufescens UP504]